MYISCPDCTTRYIVKAESIGEKGRTVKCAKCGHRWFQAPAGVEEQERIREEIPEEIERALSQALDETPRQLPVKSNHMWEAPTPLLLKVAIWLLWCVTPLLGLLAYKDEVLAKAPALSPAYEYLGVAYKEGIALYDIAMAEDTWEGKQIPWISGAFVNDAKEEEYMKQLRVVFLDKNRKKLGERYFPSTHKAPMKPGEELVFKVPVPSMPEETAYVVVDVGDSLQMMMR